VRDDRTMVAVVVSICSKSREPYSELVPSLTTTLPPWRSVSCRDLVMAGLTAKSLGSGSNIRTAARGALARTHPGGDSVYDGSSVRTESMGERTAGC